MFCPKCGHEAEDGLRFCMYCGQPLSARPAPKSDSPVKKFFLAVLRALVYFLVYLIVENVVVFTYEMAMLAGPIAQVVIAGGDVYAMYDALIEDLYVQVQQHLHLLLILSTLLTILIYCIQFRIRHKKPLEEMHVRRVPVSRALYALLLGISLQVVVSLLLYVLPIPESLVESFNEDADFLYGGPVVIEFINIAIFTPLMEEIVFRGLSYTRLRRGMRRGIAVVLSAVVFGAAHGHIISFVYAGLLGLLFVLLMERNGDSIVVTICCHAGFNAASYALAYIPDSIPLLLALGCAAAAVGCGAGYLALRPLGNAKEAADDAEAA